MCTFQMNLISFSSTGEYRSVAGLQVGRPYNIEQLYCYESNSGLCCLMLLRQTWHQRKLVTHLPKSCFKIFTSAVNENNNNNNNRSAIVDIEYLGRSLSNEPIIRLHANGCAIII
jgi:hypothetical protein